MIILKVENLSKFFGGIKANENINFSVNQGEILGVIGPNGAGIKCSNKIRNRF